MKLEFRVALADAERDQLASIVSEQHTLEEVVRWGLAQSPPRLVASVVVQDEYTHDVVIEKSRGVFLVYDTT